MFSREKLHLRKKQGPTDAAKKEREQDPTGLGKYKIWVQSLLNQFEAKFDPKDKTKTEEIYQTAKRIFKVLEYPFLEDMYGGAFLGGSTEAVPESQTKLDRERSLARIEEIKDLLEAALYSIESAVKPEVLAKIPSRILPLEGGYADDAIDEMGLGARRKYLREVQVLVGQAQKELQAITNTQETASVVRSLDLERIASIYRSLKIDADLWEALSEDIVFQRDRTTGEASQINYRYITYKIISKICDQYERAFSKDGLSEGDKETAIYLLGILPEGTNTQPLFETAIVDIPETFSDFEGHFATLGINPRELNGRSEEEAKGRLSKAYRGLAKKCHPDKHKDDPEAEGKFKKLSRAYTLLIDPIKRMKYVHNDSKK